MNCVVMANGEYGNLDYYRQLVLKADVILCADGGANYAYQMGLIPAGIIGDMDSILPQVKEYYEDKGVKINKFPRRKDFTDTQLALSIAESFNSSEVVFIGTLGKRLDHTLSNLYCGIEYAKRGIRITHCSPICNVYLVTKLLHLIGNRGDTVSALALTDRAAGVYEKGFEYPLDGVVLEKHNPYAISNVLQAEQAEIKVSDGVLAVFHFHQYLG